MIGRLLRHPLGALGVALVSISVFTALISLVWVPYDPQEFDPLNRWAKPSPEHLLGTDAGGRDLFSMLLLGAQTTVLATALATAIAVVLGVPTALLTAGASRAWQVVAERLLDILLAFPTLIIAIILVTSFGGSVWATSLAIGLGGAVVIARTLLPEARRVMAADYVMLARIGGVSSTGVLMRHVLPNITPTLVIRATQLASVAALAEAGLSYLGFGTPPPTPSWGRTLSELQNQVLIRPDVLIAPSLAIISIVIGFALLGDALRDVYKPGSPPQRKRHPLRRQRKNTHLQSPSAVLPPTILPMSPAPHDNDTKELTHATPTS